MKYLFAMLAGSLVVVLTGCAVPHYEMGRLVDNPELKQRLTQSAKGRFPKAFTVMQRRLMNRGERQLVFTEYLSVDRQQGSLKVVAVNDVGAKLFQAAYTPAAGLTITSRGPGLPARAVRAFVQDALAVYLENPTPWAILVQHDKGCLGLYSVQTDGTASEFCFDPGKRRIVGYRRIRGDSLLYEAKWVYDNTATMIPKRIGINHFRGGYTSVLRPAQVQPRAKPAAQQDAPGKP